MNINSWHQINLEKLFLELSQVFNGNSEIEKISSQELLQKAKVALAVTEERRISEDIANVSSLI
jgi:VIT1/CCC1 family predicted Fe2+/Mn2+ transporter